MTLLLDDDGWVFREESVPWCAGNYGRFLFPKSYNNHYDTGMTHSVRREEAVAEIAASYASNDSERYI